MSSSCIILLCDANSFFASVHQALDPVLRGRPVIVAGREATRHGIVLAASYEAKRGYGIQTGMTVREAKSLCPDGIFIPPRHDLYIEFSTRLLRIMRDFTPLVEPFSIDEAWLDVRGCRELHGSPLAIARRLKQRIKDEVGITTSIGLGPSKLLAKMAAEMQKPDGLTVLDYPDVPVKMWPLPVRKLFGVGPRMEAYLAKLGIHTIGDLACFPVEVLVKRFGVVGQVLHQCAHGVDGSPVDPHSLERVKSISHQITLPRDYYGYEEIEVVLLELAELVARRARLGNYLGRTVSISLKGAEFNWLGRSFTLPRYTDTAADIYTAARRLLRRHWPPWRPVRLVGVSLAGLVPAEVRQEDLFGRVEKQARLDRACDRLKNRYGERAVFRAASLTGVGVLYARG
ncbi:DNA polymerase IV [Neomoorella glycerini]|uniref:DNA polymerase IV n=1 Tax=Neomoorella glycerini TaxID=55779 RepID=A0A6I5ZN49_9FIRM|nr:DNA polymerase IV [Moorella glycerini]QGP91344.1 DNA polymerase IV [Moorella glycerini]